MKSVNITFGPPGTGKTTAMLNRVEEHLEAGIPPSRIAFASFTRKAVQEARERAALKFNLNEREFTNFRTMHSMAYSALGLQQSDIMSKSDYQLLTETTGFHYLQDQLKGLDRKALVRGARRMTWMIELSQSRQVPLREVWCEFPEYNIDWYILKYIADTLNEYKKDMGKYDFADILDLFKKEQPVLPVDAVIIDEAQDLSNVQWDVAKLAFRDAQYIDIAGDDDQAIYEWAGASVRRFLSMKGERRVLQQSYRVPLKLFHLAIAQLVGIRNRYPKQWEPNSLEGVVETFSRTKWDWVPLDNGVDWYLLARNQCHLKEFEEVCQLRGLPYTIQRTSGIRARDVKAIRYWLKFQKGVDLEPEEENHLRRYTQEQDTNKEWYEALLHIPEQRREYYLSVLRNGYKLTDEPLIHINTIHGVKGGEATNVVLRPDMTPKTYNAMQRNEDAERRVFYVAITRARQRLYIMEPRTPRRYRL